jgi:hypothetical protein
MTSLEGWGSTIELRPRWLYCHAVAYRVMPAVRASERERRCIKPGSAGSRQPRDVRGVRGSRTLAQCQLCGDGPYQLAPGM